MLTLGWTDGYRFVPVGFNMLSSANKSNRYQEMSDDIDRRTNGFKARRDSMLSKLEAAIQLIKEALEEGILAGIAEIRELSWASNIFGSLLVTTKNGISTKIVFVRNRNKKSECLYILSTNVTLSDSEIVRIYGNRWSIECFFKASKSFMKLGTEFQCRSYGAVVCHTTIVFVRYILLEWIRRNEKDERSYGELFYMFCDDIQDMDLTNALQSLMACL